MSLSQWEMDLILSLDSLQLESIADEDFAFEPAEETHTVSIFIKNPSLKDMM